MAFVQLRAPITDVDNTPQYKVGDHCFAVDGTHGKGDNEYVYLEVQSSAIATQAAKAASSAGRPAAYIRELQVAQCYKGTAADANLYNRKMVIGVSTAAIGKYAWFLFEGYYIAKHDKNQVTDGDRMIMALGAATATVNQIAAIGIASFTGNTARIQGWIDSNSASNKSATGDNILNVFLFGA